MLYDVNFLDLGVKTQVRQNHWEPAITPTETVQVNLVLELIDDDGVRKVYKVIE